LRPFYFFGLGSFNIVRRCVVCGRLMPSILPILDGPEPEQEQRSEHIRRGQVSIVTVLSLSLMWASSAGAALTDEEKCQAAKLKAAGIHAKCVLNAQSKAVKKGVPADFKQCAAKVEQAFAKAGGSCAGTASEIIAANTANADETLTNLADGCMWE